MRIMLILKLICGLYGWQKRGETRVASSEAPAFVAVKIPGAARRNTVLVLEPPTCPEQAQRADALIRDLGRAGIPVVGDSGFAFDV